MELRHAIRGLRKSAGFSLVTIATLGIGMGAVAALFTVVDGVLLKPLGYHDANRIVSVVNRYSDRDIPTLAGGDEIDIAAEPGPFEAFAYYHGGEIGVQLGDHAEFVAVRLVHPDFFRVFGVAPLAGRILVRDDAQRSAVVAVSFARRNFGSAAGALNRSVFIDKRAYDIVGVMPAAMSFPADTEVWAADPLLPDNRNRTGHNYRAVARLAPGVSVPMANHLLDRLAARLATAFPVTNAGKTFVAVPLRESLVSQVRTTLYVLMGAVGLVLLIACANAANLMLARASARATEFAVRGSLGASRGRIIGQLLIESLLLTAAASILGFVVASGGIRLLLRIGARYVPLPRLGDIHMDWRVLVFGVAVSLLTTVVAGLAPAFEASRVGLALSLRRNSTRSLLGGASSRTRGALVVAQIAMAFVLAIDAGLLLRSFVSLTGARLGFEPDGVLVMYAHAPALRTLTDSHLVDSYVRAGQVLDDLLGRLRRLPEVVSAGAVMGLPTGQYDSSGSYAVEGKQAWSGDFRLLPGAGFRLTSPGYFRTMNIPFERGRDFTEADLFDRPFVAIISRSLARQTFGDEDPLGHRIICGFDQPDKWMTVVGVVGDVRQASPAARPGPELYMPLRQHPFGANEVQVVMRTRVRPEIPIGAVRAIVHQTSPEVAVKFITLDESIEQSIASPRFRATLVSMFASLALLLAVGGIYSVMSYVTAQRTAEFGLRMALGAAPGDVLRLVFGRAGRLMIFGSAIGLSIALGTSRVIASFLFGVSSTDPVTYALVLVAAMPVIIAASAIPALRAARMDPMLALRTE